MSKQKKLKFKINELIVYPSHGVGQVVAIEEEEIAGFSLELYVVYFEKERLKLRVPTMKSDTLGMRKLADSSLVEDSLRVLRSRARVKRTMWARRAQEYEAKINSGDLIAISEVVRDLFKSPRQAEQSYSERQLYETARERVVREIAAIRNIAEEQMVFEIEEILDAASRRAEKVVATTFASSAQEERVEVLAVCTLEEETTEQAA